MNIFLHVVPIVCPATYIAIHWLLGGTDDCCRLVVAGCFYLSGLDAAVAVDAELSFTAKIAGSGQST